jgi:glycosyltransferase involved in cell wall biosynthesis/SAM-dependent methyltransferase
MSASAVAVSGVGADRAYRYRVRREVGAWFDRFATTRSEWRARNSYYHGEVARLIRQVVPSGARVLLLGCATGDLLASLRPTFGLGIDVSGAMVRVANERWGRPGAVPGSTLTFVQGDAQELPLRTRFDYIICSDLLGYLEDIQATLVGLHAISNRRTTIVITSWNWAWQPLLRVAEAVGLKMPDPGQNWLGRNDIENLFALADLEVRSREAALLSPVDVPFIGPLLNRVMVNVPALHHVTLLHAWVVRPKGFRPVAEALTTTVLVPCRNEEGNIRAAVERLPALGTHTELIFVDGASTDGTRASILGEIERHRGIRDIKLLDQVPGPQSKPDPNSPFAATTGFVNGRFATETLIHPVGSIDPLIKKAPRDTEPVIMLKLGKGDAVRKGFAVASGDVLFILDADLTVPPEDLPKFLEPIAAGRAELINGTRLVYPLEDEAMGLINLVGNRFFSIIFTWLLGQPIKDTLCGTKVLRASDYQMLAANRAYFGDFDPFGDFDLLFGAARLGLKILEVPIRYRRRTSGYSKVLVFKHGMLLLRMSLIGLRRLKLARWLGQSVPPSPVA